MIPFIEEVYPLFYGLVNKFDPAVATAAKQFKSMCLEERQFTDKQASYLLSIMASHRNQVPVDLTPVLNNPRWKLSFRQIDTAKRVWVVENKVYLQFPFSIKSHFEMEFSESETRWDSENRYRVGSLFDVNIIQIYDFALRHGFDIDPSFESIAFDAEDATSEEKKSSPYSVVLNKQVFLVNASKETDDWFDTHKTGNVIHDIFLAKRMGYLYRGRQTNAILRVSASNGNTFWLDNIDEFLQICYNLPNKICIVLDRASNTYQWMIDFVKAVKRSPVDLNQVKFCSNVKRGNPLGDFIAEHGLSRNTRDGKIMISVYKPTKWLIENAEDVMLLVTNNLYPSTSEMTRSWLESHPCVIYLSEYSPVLISRDLDLIRI